MAYLGNSPSKGNTVLRVEARKSFSFGIWLKDFKKKPLDITDCSISLVVKTRPYDTSDTADEDNLLTNSAAEILEPEVGYARINLQASDLDLATGEYPFALVLHTPEGYSAVIAKGVLEVLDNPEFASVGLTYEGGDPSSSLEIHLRELTSLSVHVGGMLPPNASFFSSQAAQQLDELVERVLMHPPFGSAAYESASSFAPASAVLPPGGFANRVLGKASSADYDVTWLNIGTGGGGGGEGLDAEGIPAGHVPTATGADLWEWEAPTVNADDITDGSTKVIMTVDERNKLAGIEEGAEENVQADWDATSGPAQILNQPTLGTAAEENVEAFAPAAHTHSFFDLENVTSGTGEPSGGSAGDIYIRILSS